MSSVVEPRQQSDGPVAMPVKLIVLLVLMGLSVANNLYRGSWLGVIIGGLLMAGVFSGNNSVRQLLIVLGWLGVIFTGVALVMALMVAGASLTLGIWVVVLIGYSLAVNVFFIWCLAQDDVREWMFR